MGDPRAKRPRLLRDGRPDDAHEAEDVHADVQQGATGGSSAGMASARDMTLDSARPPREDDTLHALDGGG